MVSRKAHVLYHLAPQYNPIYLPFFIDAYYPNKVILPCVTWDVAVAHKWAGGTWCPASHLDNQPGPGRVLGYALRNDIRLLAENAAQA